MIRLSFILTLMLILLVSCKFSSDTEEVNSGEALVLEAPPKNILEGEKVSIKVYDFDGFEGLLERSDDKTYVINFWATWCKPCIEELPHFETLNAKYGEDQVEVVLVSLDFPSRAEELLVPFVEKRDLKSDVLLLDDPKSNTWIPKVDESWSGALPATVIFNKDRRSFYEKSFTFNELETELLGFIN